MDSLWQLRLEQPTDEDMVVTIVIFKGEKFPFARNEQLRWQDLLSDPPIFFVTHNHRMEEAMLEHAETEGRFNLWKRYGRESKHYKQAPHWLILSIVYFLIFFAVH